MLARDAVRLVVGDVRVVACLAQNLLAAHHFALQGVLHTVDEGELRLQVRDHGRHVRQVRHAGEGSATLEVDENQVQLLRRVGERQGQHEGTQHLGLTRTGRADQQAVRTHTLLGGFLNVQDHGAALGRDGEGCGEAFAALAAPPLLLRVEVADIADADELHEVHLAGLVRTAHRRLRLFQVLLGGEGRHAAGHGLGLHGGEAVGERLLGQGVHGDHVDHVRALVIRVGVDDEAQRRVRLHGRPLAGAGHDRHAAHADRRTEGGVGRELGPVQHEEEVGPLGHIVARAVRAAHRDVGADHLGELARVRRDHAARAHRVAHDGRAGLGHPLDPLPVAQSIGRTQDRDLELGGVDEARQVHHDGAHFVVGALAVADDLNVAKVTQVQELADVVRVVVDADEAVHGGQTHDVHLRHRVDRGTLENEAEGLGARAVTERQQVVRVALARPQARTVGGQRHEGVGGGVDPVVVGALLLRDLAHGLARLRQVREVFAALRLDPRAVLGELTVDVEADHAQHGDQHAAAHHQGARVAVVLQSHEDHDARRTEHWDDHHQDVTDRCGLGLLRRHLDCQGAGGLLRNRDSPPFLACNHQVSSRCARTCSMRLHPV